MGDNVNRALTLGVGIFVTLILVSGIITIFTQMLINLTHHYYLLLMSFHNITIQKKQVLMLLIVQINIIKKI